MPPTAVDYVKSGQLGKIRLARRGRTDPEAQKLVSKPYRAAWSLPAVASSLL